MMPINGVQIDARGCAATRATEPSDTNIAPPGPLLWSASQQRHSLDLPLVPADDEALSILAALPFGLAPLFGCASATALRSADIFWRLKPMPGIVRATTNPDQRLETHLTLRVSGAETTGTAQGVRKPSSLQD
jgi:hypothetical protein